MAVDQDIYEAALRGYEYSRTIIEEKIAELRRLLGEAGPRRRIAGNRATRAPRRKRQLTAESRARMAAAQRRRWAKYRAQKSKVKK